MTLATTLPMAFFVVTGVLILVLLAAIVIVAQRHYEWQRDNVIKKITYQQTPKGKP